MVSFPWRECDGEVTLSRDAPRAVPDRVTVRGARWSEPFEARSYFTGKYPTFVTIACPSGERQKSMNSFTSPDGFDRVYM